MLPKISCTVKKDAPKAELQIVTGEARHAENESGPSNKRGVVSKSILGCSRDHLDEDKEALDDHQRVEAVQG